MEKIDKLDCQIISILLQDAKTTYTEIADKLDVSLSTIHVRIKKLESLDVIKGSTLYVDFERLGLHLIAFIGLVIDGRVYKQVVRRLKTIKEIVELYHTTGKYHMFAKVICRSSSDLKEILLDKINSIEGIEKTETNVSLGEIFTNPPNLIKQ